MVDKKAERIAYGYFAYKTLTDFVAAPGHAGICHRQRVGSGVLPVRKAGQFFLVRFRHRVRRMRNGRLRDIIGHRRHGRPVQVLLLPPLIPYVQFHNAHGCAGVVFRIDRFAAGFALSLYSLGYARGFFGRKNVGVLGMFFNLMLLATDAGGDGGQRLLFLMAWEVMALTAYCLVSFEHEKPETRSAGVLFFVMSHIGTGCIMLGFLLLFQAAGKVSGNYGPETYSFTAFMR